MNKLKLGEELRIKMRRRLVELLIKTGQYGEAIAEYKNLKRIDSKAKTLYKEAFKKINDIRESDQLIKRSITLNEQGHKLTHLFKSSFGLFNAEGVDQLKLRCTHKFKTLEYQPDSEYKIPQSWGFCYLQIIGKPSSTVGLYQI